MEPFMRYLGSGEIPARQRPFRRRSPTNGRVSTASAKWAPGRAMQRCIPAWAPD